MYNATHCDVINPGDNVIVGLGDSFTQGVGAYDHSTWLSISDKTPSQYNVSGQFFIEEQGKNNWVRQIRDKFLPDYKIYNCGMNGGGNRSTIKEFVLYPLPANVKNVVVVLLCTGLERYDLLKQSDKTAGAYWHQKWQTIWPIIDGNRGDISRLEGEYTNQIWSRQNDAFEFLFNIKDIENLCRANGYKFMFVPAFDNFISRIELVEDLDPKSEFIDIINWDNFIDLPDTSLMAWLSSLEDGPRNIHDIFQKMAKATMPSKYITPCAHWTIEGQFKVAELLFNEMKKRGHV